MDFDDFPRILGTLGVETDHPAESEKAAFFVTGVGAPGSGCAQAKIANDLTGKFSVLKMQSRCRVQSRDTSVPRSCISCSPISELPRVAEQQCV